MIKTMKSWSILIAEGLMYMIVRPEDLEAFCFGWAIVALMFLLFSISNRLTGTLGFGTNDSSRYAAATLDLVERQYQSNSPPKPGVPISNRWVYVFAIALNIGIMLYTK